MHTSSIEAWEFKGYPLCLRSIQASASSTLQIFRMHRLRRSASNYHEMNVHAPKRIDLQPPNKTRTAHRTPSLDTLIIPSRTRYPSDPPKKCRGTSSLDISVAQALLEANGSKSLDDSQLCRSETSESIRSFNQPHVESHAEESWNNISCRRFPMRHTSTQLSEVSYASSGLFSSIETTDPAAEEYARHYNDLASKYSLSKIAIENEGTYFRGASWMGLTSYRSKSSILHLFVEFYAPETPLEVPCKG